MYIRSCSSLQELQLYFLIFAQNPAALSAAGFLYQFVNSKGSYSAVTFTCTTSVLPSLQWIGSRDNRACYWDIKGLVQYKWPNHHVGWNFV